jgi:CoA:oxalate CoA-transferase
MPGVLGRGETAPLAHPGYGVIDGIVGSGVPITFSRSTVGLTSPAPMLGQHNDEVLGGLLGYSAARQAELGAEGVI